MRARQINAYFGQLGEGLGSNVPPQVTSVARKPLSIAFEEIAADKIVAGRTIVAEDSTSSRPTSPRPSDADRSPTAPRPAMNLAGRRIVLGVTGGIAAYKAVEVCRRLVDAGAHVAPGAHRGRHPLRRRDHLLGPGLRAGADLAVGRASTRSRTPASGRGPTSSSWRPATARLLGGLRRRHLRRPAHRHAARHPGAGDRLPGDAHRDVGAPGGAGQPRHPALARACIVVRPPRVASPAATSAPVAWPSRPTSSAAVEAVLAGAPNATSTGVRVLVTAGGTREAIDPVRVITNRSSGKQGYAIAAEAAARGAKVTLVTTVDRPGAGRRRGGRRSSARPTWRPRSCPRAADHDVIVMAAAVADFRPARGGRPQDQEGRAGGRPTAPVIVLEPTHDFLVDLGRDKPAGQLARRLRGRDRRPASPTPARSSSARTST